MHKHTPICIYVHRYLDTGTIFIILAAGQNKFNLQLYNVYVIWA